jgi:transposase
MDTSSSSDILQLRQTIAETQARADLAEAEAANTRAVNADLVARNALLTLEIEKMKRERFGQRSERSQRLIDQLELSFEEAQATAAEDERLAAIAAARTTSVTAFVRARPSRQPLPEHLPRERVVVASPACCPGCGADRLSKLGEDITETLEVIPRQWKVIQTVRERFACRACERVTQPPAPFHVTPRGLLGPSLLAMILFEKFGQHQPLNRQRDRYAHEGVDISLSTLADQVGACTAALKPLYLLIEAHVLAVERLHGDDTTVPVLAKVKADTGRIWTYVRDDRPFGGPASPAALFHYSRERRGAHAVAHLTNFIGTLQPTPMPAITSCSSPGAPRHRSRAPCAGPMPGASSSSMPILPAS